MAAFVCLWSFWNQGTKIQYWTSWITLALCMCCAEGAVFRRRVWDRPALPGTRDGDTRHPVAIDAAVAGQMCPPLLCSVEARFTWPGMGEGWALSTSIYHWLHLCHLVQLLADPCEWLLLYPGHFKAQDFDFQSNYVKSYSLLFSISLRKLSYLFSISVSEICCYPVPTHKHTEWSKDKWGGSKHFLIRTAVWSNESNKQSLGGAATCPGGCMKRRWESVVMPWKRF